MSRRPPVREKLNGEGTVGEGNGDGVFTRMSSTSKTGPTNDHNHDSFNMSSRRLKSHDSDGFNDSNSSLEPKLGKKGFLRTSKRGELGGELNWLGNVRNKMSAFLISMKNMNNERRKARRRQLIYLLFALFTIFISFVHMKNHKVLRRQSKFLERLSRIGLRRRGSLGSKSKRKGIVYWPGGTWSRDPARARQVDWWEQNPMAPLGLSCDASDTSSSSSKNPSHPIKSFEEYKYRGYKIPPPVFNGRTPVPPGPGKERVQVALVVPFVQFQLNKVTNVLSHYWSKNPPCLPGSKKISVDLIFFTENSLSKGNKEFILDVYRSLGNDKVGCFFTATPTFLSLTDEDLHMSHLEGAAFDFYMLFELLESKYKTFMLVEPDAVPIRENFLPAIVAESELLRCDSDGLWQIGSLPLSKKVKSADLQKRLDYHINGNSFYILGCPDFEEYKCRVQTYYGPDGRCELMAGCATPEMYEGGYDHALYRYRVQSDNYEYSRLVMHRFSYSNLMHNLGDAVYDPVEIVENYPSTYLVHSKSIYLTDAANALKEVTTEILKVDTCGHDNHVSAVIAHIYRYLKTGEYTKRDAARYICKIMLPLGKVKKSVCNMYKNEAGGYAEDDWKDRMEGKTYLWTMDFHGGPASCDSPIIREAGGVLHAEVDGICDYYGLCRDRLKVIRADHWKEFDPTEQQTVDFKAAYNDDPEFKRVDAFLCHHPVANCELFLPFNRSIIVHATTRLEFGRHDAGIDWRLNSGYDRNTGQEKWKKWVKTLQNLATDKRNVIAANNAYDQQYIKYFTGISDVLLLPSWCGIGIGVTICEDGWKSNLQKNWMPTRAEVMIVPYRSNLDRTRYQTNVRRPIDHPILKELRAVSRDLRGTTVVKLISELYDDANPLRMLDHPAVVIIPYQVSTMNLIELYRLNIPMFCPSLSLLKRWCREHDLLWEVHYGWPEMLVENQENIPDPNGSLNMDKNSKEWEQMFDYWIPLSDFYQMKGIIYFDSWKDFYEKYHAISDGSKLASMSNEMWKSNWELNNRLLSQWKEILARVRKS